MNKRSIIFICTHNSARSQMAEVFFRHFYGDEFDVFSAGTEPSEVNPYAIKVMAEVGIDISGQKSESVDDYIDKEIDFVVTVCDHAKEVCPYFPEGKYRIHRGFEDPADLQPGEEPLLKFRRIRDEISQWITEELYPWIREKIGE